MEIWDAYDRQGVKTGKDLIRGEEIGEGLYHLVCEVVVRHRDGDYLLLQRDFGKEAYPGYEEIGAGGSALKGETPLQGAVRELREESGIEAGELEEIYRSVTGRSSPISALRASICSWVASVPSLETEASPGITENAPNVIAEINNSVRIRVIIFLII